MGTRHLFLTTAAVLVAASVAAAGPWGQGPGNRGGKGPGKGPMGLGPRAAEALGLTEDQQERLRALGKSHREETAPLRNELLAKREELRRLWTDPDAGAESLRSKQAELQELRGRMADAGLEHHLERREVLSAEQLEKLASLEVGPGKRDRGRGERGGCW
ncbi:MAG: Spy/CpxP family protein refolding chaperone [Deferrisomatales bacterium]|nr:Spy/CpxP family protein refolding chaperone [Deferrisomatales bacterium]